MTKHPTNRFLLLYGSQTGQAEAIAEEIAETAEKHDLKADLHCLSLTEKKFWLERETCVVFIISTTGDGEPPDKAQKIWRRLKKKTLSNDYLQHLNYTLLGLGDSNYTNFCKCGKQFSSRLEDLGATTFYPRGWADDASGLEIVVEPWMEGLWLALKKQLNIPETSPGCSRVQTDILINGSTDDKVIDTSKLTLDEPISNSSHHTSLTNGVISDETILDKLITTDLQTGVSNVTINQHSTTDQSNGATGSADTASWTLPASSLADSNLTLPLLPPAFIQVHYNKDGTFDASLCPLQNGSDFSSAASTVSMATIASATCLTSENAVKTALDMELDVSNCGFSYEPGDSFSIVCPNNEEEVTQLIQRLNLSSEAAIPLTLSVIEGTKKKRAIIPEFIPQPCTVEYLLTICCDIRSPPKKGLLRMLVEFTRDQTEKRRLQELCSKQGAADYSTYIREAGLSLLDVLLAFPSCSPALSTLIEHLPRLQPRPYSASSSPLSCPGRLHFVFNVVEIPAGGGRSQHRQGLCTGWLAGLAARLHDSTDHKIGVFARKNQYFHLPDNPSLPLVMIGPGTGVAPFVGFLSHRKCLSQTTGIQFGESWLFFGCRHKNRDFLYRSTLEDLVSRGVLSRLLVSYSRDDQPISAPRYVQDNMRLHGQELVHLICDQGARVYICGDARNMARGVNDTLIDIMSDVRDISKEDAANYISEMRQQKRILEDIWT